MITTFNIEAGNAHHPYYIEVPVTDKHTQVKLFKKQIRMKNVLTGLFLLILATACSEEEPQTITPVPF